MAGIGGYPQVIYMPKDTRWADLGKGIGDLAGGLFDAWNTADATQKAQKIPDMEHRMIYLRSRLGDKSDKYIDDQVRLMTAKENTAMHQAEMMRWNAQAKKDDIQTQINQIILQNEQRKIDAEIAAKEHRAGATRAGAGGQGALAEQRESAAKKNEAEADAIREKNERAKRGEARMEEYFKRNQPMGAVPPTGGGQPTVRPQSYEVPQTDGTNGLTGGAKVRPITTGDIVAPPAPGGGPVIDTTRPVGTVSDLPGAAQPGEAPKDLSLDQMETLRKYATSGTQLFVPVPGIGQESINEALANVGSDKEAEAWKTIKGARIPKDIKLENIGGGFMAQTGLYEDGKRYIVPGTRVEDKRKPMDAQEQRAEQNVTLWQSANQNMKELAGLGDTPIGGSRLQGFLQTGVGRMANQWLIQNTGQSLTADAPWYLAQYALARTSLDSMMSGLRETDRFRALLDTTQPSYRDSPDVKRAKFATLEMTSDLMIKARMEDALKNGKQYGSAMANAYKSRGLDKLSEEDITKRYQEQARAAITKGQEKKPDSTTAKGGRGTVIKTPQGNVTIEPD